MSLRIFRNIVLFSLLVPAIILNAKDKKEESYLNRMIMLDGTLSKGTGFIGMFRDSKYVISNQEILFRNGTTKLVDLQGGEIKYSKVLIPNDNREIVFFEIENAEEKPFMSIQENISETMQIDSKVTAYGTDNSNKVIIKGEGKLLGMGVDSLQISVKSKRKQEINGGPVLSKDGNVIGVSIQPVGDSMTCIRLDTIKDLKELDMDKFQADSKILSDFEAVCEKHKAVLAEISSALDAFSSKIGTDTSIDALQKAEILKKVEKTSSAFDASMAQKSYKTRQWSMEYFKKAYENHATELSSLGQEYKKLDDSAKEMDKKYKDWWLKSKSSDIKL